jgi:hypothetical protein
VVNWRNQKVPDNLISVHGDSDYLFPLGDRKIDYVIKGGGHPMLLTHAVAVNQVLDKIFEQINEEIENKDSNL